jgi:hypothetical protein
MTNHPNRNWRQHMQQAADQWMQTSMARVLIEVSLATLDGLRNRIRAAYCAGYQDGRKKPA